MADSDKAYNENCVLRLHEDVSSSLNHTAFESRQQQLKNNSCCYLETNNLSMFVTDMGLEDANFTAVLTVGKVVTVLLSSRAVSSENT